jgi:hypothetical protein
MAVTSHHVHTPVSQLILLNVHQLSPLQFFHQPTTTITASSTAQLSTLPVNSSTTLTHKIVNNSSSAAVDVLFSSDAQLVTHGISNEHSAINREMSDAQFQDSKIFITF